MQTMTKQQFLALADESLIFAQCKAEAFGVTRAQVDLWTASYRQFERNAPTGLILPVQTNQLTKLGDNRVLQQNERALLPFFLRRQA